MSFTSKFTLILALVLSCIPAFGQSGNSGGIKTTNSPFAGAVLITDGTRYYWATPTNLQANVTNAQPPSTTLTNLSATGVAPGATNASAYVGSNGGKGTNNQFWGTTTNVSLYATSSSEFLDNVTIGGELNILGYPNVADSLDSLQGRQGGSGVLTNLSGTGALTNASTRDFYNTGGNLYSKNLSLNHRWVYYDDFNQPMTTPGVFPDSPTGHKYNVFTGGGGNTNKINLVDGKWWLGETGAVYQSVTFGTNGVYGSAAPINTWGGTFSYQRSTNNTPDGYEQNLFLILSPQVDFLPTNYLHITVGANIFRVQRELSATNIIYAQHFGGRYLAFDTNHSFTVTIISNNIICDIAGMRYVGYDESLSTTYGNVKVATWEAIGSPTNQFWAKWDSQYAGYSDNEAHWQYAGPFAVRSNGVLSRVTSTNFTLSVDDAYASGWNGSLDVPSKNAIYDKIETLGSGGGGTNFAGIIVTNGLERTVLWTSTTNLSLSWNAANEVIWSPVGVTASLAMTGTPGNSTNAQVINLKLRLTDAGTTSVTFPTNGIDGLAPFVLTAPSTNEYALIYDGQTFRIASYQSPSTGSGQVLVVNTNPVIWNPTFGINGGSNSLAFGTPSAGQVLSVHSSSSGVTVWTNATPSSAGGGSTTNVPPVVLAINGGTGTTNVIIDMWVLAQMSTNSVQITLTANAGIVVTNVIAGKELVIDVIQDSTGNRTIAASSVGGAPLRFGTDITGFGLSTNGTYKDHIKLRGVGTNAHVVGMIRGYAP